MFCGPVAAGAEPSCTKTWGSIGFGCFVSLEKNAAWVVNVNRFAPAASLAVTLATKITAMLIVRPIRLTFMRFPFECESAPIQEAISKQKREIARPAVRGQPSS